MTQKFSAQRKRAFLTYLSQSGNQTLSAERAKVSRSWVCLHRSTDAEFDAACKEAIAVARVRLEALARNGSPPHPPLRGTLSREGRGKYFGGAELVVRGTGGSGGGKRVQIGRARVKQWTPRVEQRFLTALAETCNVKAACAEVGMWPPSAYNHRNRWPAFAQAWDEAIETGYVRIETALVEAGCNLFSSPGTGESGDGQAEVRVTSMTVDQAIHLLHMNKHKLFRQGKAPGLPPHVATPEEVEAALKKGLKRVESLLRQEAKRK